MSDIIIHVENLSKQYRIGQRERYKALRDTLTDAMYAPFRRLSALRNCWTSRNERRENGQYIWALKDVSFEVKHGEVVGITGRNGAGKSTLLKILSRITEPTEGYARIHGRVGSLLEVGTGFHPELTGRENIYLNGAILGMKRAEINRRFDEIVAFAEVEQFIDTPVKHYSSGMYLRLAFAVAAHLEPEILLVDEVLAVGDAAFQKKCLGKMGDVARGGRTVLFVSHNMPAVQRLCSRAYLLEGGRVAQVGDAASIVDAYYRTTTGSTGLIAEDREVPDGSVRYTSWSAGDSNADSHSSYSGEGCRLQFRLAACRTVKQANFGIALWASDGSLVWAMRNLDHGGEYVRLEEGIYQLEFSVPALPLRPGSYQILVSANDLVEGTLDAWYAQPQLNILPLNESGLPTQWQGILNMQGLFNMVRITDDQVCVRGEGRL